MQSVLHASCMRHGRGCEGRGGERCGWERGNWGRLGRRGKRLHMLYVRCIFNLNIMVRNA